MKNVSACLLVALVLLPGADSTACTMIMVARDGVFLAGNNEDYNIPETYMWFVPATETEYGRVCFGFEQGFGFTQGGMNDQGLFIDGNALAPTGWQADPEKEYFREPVMDYVLSHCATVDDVAALFEKYNHRSLAQARFPVADARGNSAMIEWSRDGLQVVRATDWYQISTNFVQSDYSDPARYPCRRYRNADRMLSRADAASLDLVKSVLSTTHAEGTYPTLYSFICDLNEKTVYLYYFHNFEEMFTVNLDDELKKGRHAFFIPDLFKEKTTDAIEFEQAVRQKKASRELLPVVDQQGVGVALVMYEQARDDPNSLLDVSPLQMALLADRLNDRGDTDGALLILTTVLEDYPNDRHLNFIHAYALSKKGNTEEAIAILKATVARYPDLVEGKELLTELEGK